MTHGGLRKTGWILTRHGWKRVPRRLFGVKLVPMPPKKRKTRKLRRISPASPKPETPIRAKIPQIAVVQGRADSAPTLAPKPEKPVLPQIRRAWSGKYDELSSLPSAPVRHPPSPRLRGTGGFDGQGAGQ